MHGAYGGGINSDLLLNVDMDAIGIPGDFNIISSDVVDSVGYDVINSINGDQLAKWQHEFSISAAGQQQPQPQPQPQHTQRRV